MNWRRFSRYRKWKYGVGRGRLESLSPAVCGSATISVAFDAHGPWCSFVEYRMSNVEYQANFTHVEYSQYVTADKPETTAAFPVSQEIVVESNPNLTPNPIPPQITVRPCLSFHTKLHRTVNKMQL